MSLSGFEVLCVLIELGLAPTVSSMLADSEVFPPKLTPDYVWSFIETFVQDLEDKLSFFLNPHSDSRCASYLGGLVSLCDALTSRDQTDDVIKVQVVLIRSKLAMYLTVVNLQTWFENIRFDDYFDVSTSKLGSITKLDNTFVDLLVSYVSSVVNSYPFLNVLDTITACLLSDSFFESCSKMAFGEILSAVNDHRLVCFSLLIYTLHDTFKGGMDLETEILKFCDVFSVPADIYHTIACFWAIDTSCVDSRVLQPLSSIHNSVGVLTEQLLKPDNLKFVPILTMGKKSLLTLFETIDSLVRFLSISGNFSNLQTLLNQVSSIKENRFNLNDIFLVIVQTVVEFSEKPLFKNRKLLHKLLVFPWNLEQLFALTSALSTSNPVKACSLLISRGFYVEAAELISSIDNCDHETKRRLEQLVQSVANGLAPPQRLEIFNILKKRKLPNLKLSNEDQRSNL
ncbi:hypothetical protein GEMRC1_002653 [Eukaryota sp. GEM-RC1]